MPSLPWETGMYGSGDARPDRRKTGPTGGTLVICKAGKQQRLQTSDARITALSDRARRQKETSAGPSDQAGSSALSSASPRQSGLSGRWCCAMKGTDGAMPDSSIQTPDRQKSCA